MNTKILLSILLISTMILSACASGDAVRYIQDDEEQTYELDRGRVKPTPSDRPPVIEEFTFDFAGCSEDYGEIARVEDGDRDLHLGDSLNDFHYGVYTAEHFPQALAHREVRDDNNHNYRYTQSIKLGAIEVDYFQDSDEGSSDEPVYHLDLNANQLANELYYTLNFHPTPADFTDMNSGQSLEMFGKEYLIDRNHQLGDDLVLIHPNMDLLVSQNEPVRVHIDEVDYKIEVLGGNSDDMTTIIRVIQESSGLVRQETLSEGESHNFLGLEIYVDNTFICNNGENSICVYMFLDVEQVVIPSYAIGPNESYQEVEINGEDMTDLYAWVEAQDLSSVNSIHFKIDPTDFENERTSQDWDWMVEGDIFSAPLFGFELRYEGFKPSIGGREMTELYRAGNSYYLDFENVNGEEFSVEAYEYVASSNKLNDTLSLSRSFVLEDEIFIANDIMYDEGKNVTKLYEVENIDYNANPKTVEISVLGGPTTSYEEGDQIGNSGLYINHIYGYVQFSGLTHNEIYVNGGGHLVLNKPDYYGRAEVKYYEDPSDLDDVAEAKNITMSIYHYDGSDNDIDMVMYNPFSYDYSVYNDGSTIYYGVSKYGTMLQYDEANTGDFLRIFPSDSEQDFYVYLTTPGAMLSTGKCYLDYYYRVSDDNNIASITTSLVGPRGGDAGTFGEPGLGTEYEKQGTREVTGDGEYRYTLTVEDGRGQTTTESRTAEVRRVDNPPTIDALEFGVIDCYVNNIGEGESCELYYNTVARDDYGLDVFGYELRNEHFRIVEQGTELLPGGISDLQSGNFQVPGEGASYLLNVYFVDDAGQISIKGVGVETAPDEPAEEVLHELYTIYDIDYVNQGVVMWKFPYHPGTEEVIYLGEFFEGHQLVNISMDSTTAVFIPPLTIVNSHVDNQVGQDESLLIWYHENEPVCGDNECEPGETYVSCPQDCDNTGAICGDGICVDGLEDSTSCPQDCPAPTPFCGDGICNEPVEDGFNCPTDCTTNLLPSWTECVDNYQTTCNAICAERGLVCSDTCTTSRGYENWGAEAYEDAESCNNPEVLSRGQTYCHVTGSGVIGSSDRWKCCCGSA